jgi:glutamine synthetase
MKARMEINLRNTAMCLSIEALTMTEMVNKDIIPAVSSYIKTLADTEISKSAIPEVSCELEKEAVFESFQHYR